VIAIGHCGLEYIPYPPPYVAAAFRSMIDAGADCVIGHHPHVPQGSNGTTVSPSPTASATSCFTSTRTCTTGRSDIA